MATTSQRSLALGTATLLVWALAGASAIYWGLRMSTPVPSPAAALPAAAPPAVDGQALARLLGSTPQAAAPAVQASVASRFRLVGILAGRSGSAGAALIAVDGKPAKPYRVGSEVDPGLVLRSVAPRRIVLGAAAGAGEGSELALEMAPRP